MTQNLPAPKPQIVAGGQVAALIPQTLDEAFRVANAIAASKMAPKGIDSAEQIMVAIMAGAELGLAPFQSLQSFAIVNNRPTLWGDGLLAVVRARGVRVKEWLQGEGDQMVARCLAVRPDTGEEIERSFSVADAKKASLWGKQGPWQQYPKRMLQMRARALALRDGCADMLRGIHIREEVEDFQPIRDVTPRPTGLRERLEARQDAPTEGFQASQQADAADDLDQRLDGDQIPDHDAETGEVVEAEVEEPADDFPGDHPVSSFDVLAWADALERNLPDYAGVDVLRADWTDHKADLQAASPERFKDLNYKVAQRAKAIAEKAAAEVTE